MESRVSPDVPHPGPHPLPPDDLHISDHPLARLADAENAELVAKLLDYYGFSLIDDGG